MIVTLLAAAVLVAPTVGSSAPGDGLGLISPAEHPRPGPPATSQPTVPPGFSLVPDPLVATAGILGGLRPTRPARRRRSSPVVVVIPGFGSPSEGTFDHLLETAGVPPGAVRRFDWRWVTGDADHAVASRRAHTDEAADTLERFLHRLGETTDHVYLVGHSKGGALIAELAARWDARPERSVAAVGGAMLLDPPIADGRLGRLQRLGSAWGLLPSNGGYDPIECGWFTCRDTREHLGAAAGIDVLAVRNPDALVTSFTDEPEGLRVLDLADDGGPPALDKLWEQGSVVERIVEAHESPLVHPAVAACLHAELDALGSCRWTAGPAHGPSIARGGGGRSFH